MVLKARKTEMGYVQGTCDKCGAEDQVLSSHKKLNICNNCQRAFSKNAPSIKQLKQDAREKVLWDERTSAT
jgi:hypothetical protein